ncbi:MAG: VanR-ABDEGLN family response regulator transcription factor [Lachnospiraceae bacterium]|nr:VanR-ABDEGLN family response regulator transcription factor [Lachnospiraceae bacterium]
MERKDKLLIVDDEHTIADLISLYLENEGFQVLKFYNAADALLCIQTEVLDLAILDVMLPDINGFQLCQQIREKHHYPIIMLTAKGEEMDKITGLSLGADDYITKPFHPLELVARVKAQLRRYKRYNTGLEQNDEIMVLSGLVLDKKAHKCTLDDKPLSLTPTEFSILQILCQNKGKVVSSEDLFHQIWKEEYFTKNNNTITAHIRHLREKMGDSYENPKYIKTVWGYGYKIEE